MNKSGALHFTSWVVSLLLAITLSACGGDNPFPGANNNYWESETNHSSNQADAMPLSYTPAADGRDFTGYIAPSSAEDDWFRLQTTQSGQLTVHISCFDLTSNDNVDITLYDSASNELDTQTLSTTSGGSATASTAAAAPAGAYLVRIESDNSRHSYDLTPGFTGGGIASDFWETENNNTSSQADVMSLNYNPGTDGYDYTGTVTAGDTGGDWIQFTTAQAGQLQVALTCNDLASNEHIYITLYNSTPSQLDTSTLSGTAGGTVSVVTAAGAPTGTYYARVDADSWAHDYDVTPTFNSGGAFTDYWEQENNDNSSQADAMPLNYSPASDGFDFTGTIASNDSSDDWYRLNTTQSGQVSATLTCSDLFANQHMYLTLYDSGLNELDSRTLTGTLGGSTTASTFFGASAGVYYLRVEADSWPHNYDLAPGFMH